MFPGEKETRGDQSKQGGKREKNTRQKNKVGAESVQEKTELGIIGATNYGQQLHEFSLIHSCQLVQIRGYVFWGWIAFEK